MYLSRTGRVPGVNLSVVPFMEYGSPRRAYTAFFSASAVTCLKCDRFTVTARALEPRDHIHDEPREECGGAAILRGAHSAGRECGARRSAGELEFRARDRASPKMCRCLRQDVTGSLPLVDPAE